MENDPLASFVCKSRWQMQYQLLVFLKLMHAKPIWWVLFFFKTIAFNLFSLRCLLKIMTSPGRPVFTNGKRPQFQIGYVVIQIQGYQKGTEMLFMQALFVKWVRSKKKKKKNLDSASYNRTDIVQANTAFLLVVIFVNIKWVFVSFSRTRKRLSRPWWLIRFG